MISSFFPICCFKVQSNCYFNKMLQYESIFQRTTSDLKDNFFKKRCPLQTFSLYNFLENFIVLKYISTCPLVIDFAFFFHENNIGVYRHIFTIQTKFTAFQMTACRLKIRTLDAYGLEVHKRLCYTCFTFLNGILENKYNFTQNVVLTNMEQNIFRISCEVIIQNIILTSCIGS